MTAKPSTPAACLRIPGGNMELSLIDSAVEGIKIFSPPPVGFDALAATDDQLRKYGFPRRPNPSVSTKRTIARWQRAVCATRVVPDLVLTEYVHGPIQKKQQRAGLPPTTNNWSGYVAHDTTNAFQDARITTDFEIPKPLNLVNPGPNHLSIWVGFDGDGSPDVLQAGVHVITSGKLQGQSTQSYLWIEWFPQYEVRVGGLPANPGDWVEIQIEHYPAVGGFPPMGGASLANISTGQSVGLAITPPAGTALVGNCAEWIVERPGVNNVLSSLPDFVTTIMMTCDATGPGVYAPGKVPAAATIVDYAMTDASGTIIMQANLAPPHLKANAPTEYGYTNVTFLGGTTTGNP